MLFFLLCGSLCFADVREDFKDDLEIADQTKTYKEEYTVLDGLLNKYYKRLMRISTDAEKKKIKESQRAWLKFRDKEFSHLDTQSKKNDILKARIQEFVDLIAEKQDED